MISTSNAESVYNILKDDLRYQTATFLVGAGVSTIAPSKLPSGDELRDFALECLFDNEEFSKHHKAILNNDKYKSTVPEIIFGEIFDIIKDRVYIFYELLKTANANHIHRLIAEIADNYQINIYTTNFDLLLDKCIKNRDLIIHLHGVLDRPDSMVMLLSRILKGGDNKLFKRVKKTLNDKNIY